MGNIYTYLKWRGDLDFSERPFCEVDNLVLAELAYVNLAGIVPTADTAESISLEEAAEQAELQKRRIMAVNEDTESLLSCMMRTKRFHNVRLSHYADILDEETQTQFAALHIELNDGTT